MLLAIANARNCLGGFRHTQPVKVHLQAVQLVLTHRQMLLQQLRQRAQCRSQLFIRGRFAIGIADAAASLLGRKQKYRSNHLPDAHGEQDHAEDAQNKNHSSSSSPMPVGITARLTHNEVARMMASTTAKVILPGTVYMSLSYQSGIMIPISGMLPSTTSTIIM